VIISHRFDRAQAIASMSLTRPDHRAGDARRAPGARGDLRPLVHLAGRVVPLTGGPGQASLAWRLDGHIWPDPMGRGEVPCHA
jgi:hypothetical protein